MFVFFIVGPLCKQLWLWQPRSKDTFFLLVCSGKFTNLPSMIGGDVVFSWRACRYDWFLVSRWGDSTKFFATLLPSHRPFEQLSTPLSPFLYVFFCCSPHFCIFHIVQWNTSFIIKKKKPSFPWNRMSVNFGFSWLLLIVFLIFLVY